MLNGFSISLGLIHQNFNGLDAVDKCRALRLPNEMAHLYTSQDRIAFVVTDETKIRTWFDHCSIIQLAGVKVDWLAPNEIHQDGNRICISKDIPEGRIWELFIRGLVDKLRSEIEALNGTLSLTRAELSAALCELAQKNDRE